ncbi:hypothetical protein M885DRAFT_548948, partial [Pelagophyceae sp. CCMP2097]
QQRSPSTSSLLRARPPPTSFRSSRTRAPISTTSTLPRRFTASGHPRRCCKTSSMIPNSGDLANLRIRAGALPRSATLKRRRCSRR